MTGSYVLKRAVATAEQYYGASFNKAPWATRPTITSINFDTTATSIITSTTLIKSTIRTAEWTYIGNKGLAGEYRTKTKKMGQNGSNFAWTILREHYNQTICSAISGKRATSWREQLQLWEEASCGTLNTCSSEKEPPEVYLCLWTERPAKTNHSGAAAEVDQLAVKYMDHHY